MKEKNQLKIGAFLSYVSLVLGNIISIIYTPIMLRLLSQSEYGLYNISNSIVGYLGVLDFGMGSAVVKYTSQYRALHDREKESSLYGMFLIVYSVLSIVVIFFGTIILLNIDLFFSNTIEFEDIKKIKIMLGLMMFNLAITFPFSIFNSIIVAYEKFIFLKVLNIIRQILNPFLTIPLLFLGYGSISLTVVATILNIFIISSNMYYCFKKLNIKIKFKKVEINIFKEIVQYSFFIFIAMIADKIYWSTDQFILGSLVSSVAVAIYSVGSTINCYYMSFSIALSGVFLPKITMMVARQESDKELSNLFVKTGRIQFIIMSFILGGFVLVGRSFVVLWGGIDYLDAYYIALIIMLPFTIDLIQNTAITIMQAKNKYQFRALVLFIIGVINIVFSIPLAKNYGGIGCAISTAFSLFIGNLLLNIYYSRKIGLDIQKFWREIITLGIPGIMSFTITLVIKQFINCNGILDIAINGIIYTLFFGIMMWSFGMNEDEKNIILIPFKRVINKLILKEA